MKMKYRNWLRVSKDDHGNWKRMRGTIFCREYNASHLYGVVPPIQAEKCQNGKETFTFLTFQKVRLKPKPISRSRPNKK